MPFFWPDVTRLLKCHSLYPPPSDTWPNFRHRRQPRSISSARLNGHLLHAPKGGGEVNVRPARTTSDNFLGPISRH